MFGTSQRESSSVTGQKNDEPLILPKMLKTKGESEGFGIRCEGYGDEGLRVN